LRFSVAVRYSTMAGPLSAVVPRVCLAVPPVVNVYASHISWI